MKILHHGCGILRKGEMFVDVFQQDDFHTQQIIWLGCSMGGRSLWRWAVPVAMVTDWLTGCYSKDCSMRSCLSTFVWLVSRISPARNISSTTVYTWNTTATAFLTVQLVLQQFIQKCTLSYLICKTSKWPTWSKLPDKRFYTIDLHAFCRLSHSLYF